MEVEKQIADESGHSPTRAAYEARAVAESFGADADAYDRFRPRYPAAMVDALVAAIPGVQVLDVGTGTGIAARQFAAAGCEVVGVDVDARMAAHARAVGLDVEVAKFEDWDPTGREFDAVIAGQAWHWVDPVAGAAKAASVLRPGGRLAVFWNVFELPEELREPVAGAHRTVLSDLPFLAGESGGIDAYAPRFAEAQDGLREAEAFGEPEQWRFDWEQTYTTAEWLRLVPTYGGYNRLPEEKLRSLLAALGDAVEAVGGSFAMQYATVVVTAVRRA